MSKSKLTSAQRIIWAIDPFEEKCGTSSHVISALQEFSSRGARIEPIYVLRPNEYDIDVGISMPWLKQIRPATQKVLEQYLKRVKIPGLENPKVIIEKRPSLTRAVLSLAAYAKRNKSNMILVGTHAKKGLSRLFLGSFAETLLLHSEVPVLVVGPHAEVPHPDPKAESILFSTDFGQSSYSTFKGVLLLAKARDAKVTLFHCLPHPVEPFFQSGMLLIGGSYLSLPDFLTQDEQRKRKVALRYIGLAKKRGVEVELIFNAGHGSTAQAIVDQAQREKSSLIAMAAKSGAVSAALVGSVTRQVVRGAPCPVWVLRAS